MKELNIVWSIDIATNFLCILMHLSGIYSIILSRRKTNQLLILLNLSLSEVLATIYNISNDVYRLVQFRDSTFEGSISVLQWNISSSGEVFNNSLFDDIDTMEDVFLDNLPPYYHEISYMFFASTSFEVLFICLVLTFDRLICIIIPLKYKVIVTRRRLRVIMVFTWLLSIIIGILYGMLSVLNVPIAGIFISVGCIYIVVVILTYSIVIYKLRNQMRVNSRINTQNAPQSRVQFKRKYGIPALIVLTFFLLYATPLTIRRYHIRGLKEFTKSTLIVHECLAIVVNIGLMADVVIYVFLTPYLRVVITKPCSNGQRHTHPSCSSEVGCRHDTTVITPVANLTWSKVHEERNQSTTSIV